MQFNKSTQRKKQKLLLVEDADSNKLCAVAAADLRLPHGLRWPAFI